jgi:hypothetical protein
MNGLCCIWAMFYDGSDIFALVPLVPALYNPIIPAYHVSERVTQTSD